MKRPNPYLVLAAALLVFGPLAGAVVAQGPSAPTASGVGAVALVDVNHIFKEHQRFKMQMDEMRTEVERAEASVQQERAAIQKLAEQLEQYKGTRDYRAMEEDIADRQAKLAVKVRMQQREFLENEARIYHNTYKEIWQAVDYVCRNQNIAMVLRFNGDVADTTKPEEVLRDIQKPVVWYRSGLDITDRVLAELNRDARPAGGHQPTTSPIGQTPFRREELR